MTVEKIKHLNIAQAVCERPRIFTPNGTLAEVIVFLAGCKYGLSTASANDDSAAKLVDWFLRDVMEDQDVKPMDRFAAAIAQFESMDAGLDAMREFAATIDAD